MNTLEFLTSSIEERRKETKSPCKNYASQSAATKATSKLAQKVANHFASDQSQDAKPARYLVFYIEPWGRWVGAIDMTELVNRQSSTGGYLGIASEAGFFSY